MRKKFTEKKKKKCCGCWVKNKHLWACLAWLGWQRRKSGGHRNRLEIMHLLSPAVGGLLPKMRGVNNSFWPPLLFLFSFLELCKTVAAGESEWSWSNLGVENNGRSSLSTWKYQFLCNHWSQATLSSVSTWIGDCSKCCLSVAANR